MYLDISRYTCAVKPRGRGAARYAAVVLSVLALSLAWKNTLGLGIVFFVAFPALAHGLLVYAGAQIASEREQNRRYREGLDDQ
jgi:hypothetical protein